MAISAKYYINYSASATPIEEVFGNNADSGKDSSRLVHSDIDKSVGGSKEFYAGETATKLQYKDYPTTTATVLMSHADIIGTFSGAEFLMITIRSAASTGTPNCLVEFSNGVQWVTVCRLTGVGDVMVLPVTNKNLAEVRLSSSASTTIANLDILAGKD